ncbi:MAG: CbiQ family ECF transporter T component [Gemmataceae bacterium]
MQVRFRLPPQPDSFLARLDGRWRLATLLLLMLASAIAQGLVANLLGLALAGLVTLVARVPLGWLAKRLANLGLLLLLFAGPLALLGQATEATQIVVKGLSLGLLTAVMLVSAPVEQTAQAARMLGMPALFVYLLTLTYRYTFLLADELQRLRLALRLRGYRNRADWRSYEVVAAATGTLLVRGAERAARVAAAMRCRGFNGQFAMLTNPRTGGAEVLTLAASLILAAGVLGLSWLG